MDSVPIWDLWLRWISGQEVVDYQLGWWTVFVWGRVGKALGGLGIALLIAEIVGEAWFRRTGASLERLREGVIETVPVLILLLPVVAFAMVLLAVLWPLKVICDQRSRPLNLLMIRFDENKPTEYSLTLLDWFIVALFLLGLALAVVISYPILLVTVVVKVLAISFTSRRIGVLLKWLTAFLLVTGFHFDMLAS